MKSDGWERKAVVLQRAADSNNMKGFYNGLKEVWGLKKKGPVQLKSADGMETFSDSKRVVARWSEHFQKLLNIPGDIYQEALTHITPKVVPETHCGFIGNRRTVYIIFCLRKLQEKCIEQDRPLYMVSVDFSNAFDTVGVTQLWQLLGKYSCSQKFTTMIEALNSGMMANISVGGEISESFSVTNGVKQGWPWSWAIFCI